MKRMTTIFVPKIDTFLEATNKLLNTTEVPPTSTKEVKSPGKKSNFVEPRYSPLPKPLFQRVNELIFKPKVIQRITIVGTHGWFPNKLLNKIVGEPRGTSQLLIEKTLNSLQAYQKQHNMESEIKYIALQGQGKVQERVDSYYSTIVKDKEYMKILQQSDQIICASHSQGCIVSTLLLKKLLQNKIINDTTRIGSLLLAGINHGPFHSLSKSIVVKLESDPAKELFEFITGKKQIEYQNAIKYLTTKHDARFYFCGAWNDQVVPLFSGIFNNVNSTKIYRAVFIHQNDYNDDFIYHLCVFLCKVRNYGLNDHGLLQYLSEFFKGSVYGFGTQGHSEVYEEDQSYMVGLEFLLDDRSLWNGPFAVDEKVAYKYSNSHIPFALALVFTDKLMEEKFPKDIAHLKEMFLKWMPTGVYKELKYRMEPLRSKL